MKKQLLEKAEKISDMLLKFSYDYDYYSYMDYESELETIKADYVKMVINHDKAYANEIIDFLKANYDIMPDWCNDYDLRMIADRDAIIAILKTV